jgi:hypothetical protein
VIDTLKLSIPIDKGNEGLSHMPKHVCDEDAAGWEALMEVSIVRD